MIFQCTRICSLCNPYFIYFRIVVSCGPRPCAFTSASSRRARRARICSSCALLTRQRQGLSGSTSTGVSKSLGPLIQAPYRGILIYRTPSRMMLRMTDAWKPEKECSALLRSRTYRQEPIGWFMEVGTEGLEEF